ncbi:SpoIID/LytB domain-containing protein, partial [Candidatus Uhrbacteria bacterium]|nr:SpoIID/LytB domain-containing protein [Candidatus Uhrbacteria bacterium]
MEYSLSAIEKSLLHVEHAEGQTEKCHESVRERIIHLWDMCSHIIVALFVTVLLAGSLSLLERALTSPAPSLDGITRAAKIGLETSPRWHRLLGVSTAHAAGGYGALIVSIEPSSVKLHPGESTHVRVNMKNIGAQAWKKSGRGYLSVYTYEPKYHVSPYRGSSWWSDHQTGQLVEDDVKPGEVGTIDFFVYAPPNFEGNLTETFRIAAEEVSWVDGGTFVLPMKVAESELEEPTEQEIIVEADTDATGYTATLVVTSATRVVAAANQPISFKALFENTGTKLWRTYELHTAGTALAAEDLSVAYHPSWPSSKVAIARSAKVTPGSTEVVDFMFRAPSTKGEHQLRFQLVANGVNVEGGVIDIPVEVTTDAQMVVSDPVREERVVLEGAVMDVPRVRVGIDTLEGEAIFSANSDVRVVEADARLLRMVIPSGQPMRVAWNGSQYVFESGGNVLLADNYLRFEGVNGAETIFTVTSYSDVRSYNTSFNDNRFRDTLEVHYNTRRDRTWLINELPIEHYLYGLDESSGKAPEEYLKSLVTAARTYALYMWEHKTKYDGEFIDLKGTAADQVYHGYGAQERHPSVTKAVDDTKGVTIQYA